MATKGFDHIYLETHDWAASLAFWRALGFELEWETDHHSGMLRNPAGGPAVFLAEQSLDDPLGIDLYLAGDPATPPEGVTVVQPFTPTHWGSQVMIVRDPDGRRIKLEAAAD